MQTYEFTTSIDLFIMRMFKKLYDELYFLQTMVLSSNKLLYGRNLLFTNSGDRNKLDINYNLWKTEEEVLREREHFFEMRKKEILESVGKTEINKVIPNQIPSSLTTKNNIVPTRQPNQNTKVNKITSQPEQVIFKNNRIIKIPSQQQTQPQQRPQTQQQIHKQIQNITKPQKNNTQNIIKSQKNNTQIPKTIAAKELKNGNVKPIENKTVPKMNIQENKNANNKKKNNFKNNRKFKTIKEML
jgi:hypothetical protein